jgi:hypothetical protein
VASPTDNVIAFARDGDLYLASTDGATPPPCPAPRVRSTDATGTQLCDLTGSATDPATAVMDPTWSWDGRTIAYAVGSPSTSAVDLISVAGGKPRQLNPPMAIGASGWGPR